MIAILWLAVLIQVHRVAIPSQIWMANMAIQSSIMYLRLTNKDYFPHFLCSTVLLLLLKRPLLLLHVLVITSSSTRTTTATTTNISTTTTITTTDTAIVAAAVVITATINTTTPTNKQWKRLEIISILAILCSCGKKSISSHVERKWLWCSSAPHTKYNHMFFVRCRKSIFLIYLIPILIATYR